MTKSLDWTIFNPFSHFIVGLDIQQKFSVFYSGARRFGTDSPYNTTYDSPGQRQNQQSIDKAAPQRELTTAFTEQGTFTDVFVVGKICSGFRYY